MQGRYGKKNKEYCISMTKGYSYGKAAGISLFIHVSLISLAAFMIGPVTSTSTAQDPMPIEIEIEPSKLIDMGSGQLHLTSSTPVTESKKAKQRKQPEDPPDTPKIEPVQATPIQEGEPIPNSVAVPVSNGNDIIDSGDGGNDGVGDEKIISGGTDSADRDGDAGGGEYSDSGVISGSLPPYPKAARHSGREGEVLIRVLLGVDGIPVSVTLRQSSGYDDFDDAAVQAVKKWHFSPAKKGGQPVASFHDVKVRFRLDEAK
jgi:periplasmic protein TonB